MTVLRELALAPVKLYRLAVSPFLAPRCKYHPSCSQYAIEAVRMHGVARGTVLAGWRLLRCNPWSHGGFDPPEGQTLFRRPSLGR